MKNSKVHEEWIRKIVREEIAEYHRKESIERRTLAVKQEALVNQKVNR